jgi:hypothetical protein
VVRGVGRVQPLDGGGRRRPAVQDSPPRTPNPAAFERKQLIRAKNSNFFFLFIRNGERGLGRMRTSSPTRAAAASARWPAAGASSGGRSRHTAAASRLTEEGGSPRGFSAPAFPSPPRAAHRTCGVEGPPPRLAAPPAEGAAAGCAALSGRRRLRRRGARGSGGGAEEAGAGREAGGIGGGRVPAAGRVEAGAGRRVGDVGAESKKRPRGVGSDKGRELRGMEGKRTFSTGGCKESWH